MEANREIRSDVNNKFFVQYQNIYLGEPMVLEESQIVNNKVVPFLSVLIGRLPRWSVASEV